MLNSEPVLALWEFFFPRLSLLKVNILPFARELADKSQVTWPLMSSFATLILCSTENEIVYLRDYLILTYS